MKILLGLILSFATTAFADDVQPAQAAVVVGKVHLAQIQNVAPRFTANGEVHVDVTYLLHCNETFMKIGQEDLPPMALALRRMAVMVLVEDSGFQCRAADRIVVDHFTVPRIAGGYKFEVVQPN